MPNTDPRSKDYSNYQIVVTLLISVTYSKTPMGEAQVNPGQKLFKMAFEIALDVQSIADSIL